MTQEEFKRHFDVSRETVERLERFGQLLLRWNARINLIGRSTGSELWRRHILDSAQLLPLAPKQARTWIDLGSGAGLPGLIIALLAEDLRPGLNLTLVESDQRKGAFIATAMRELSLRAELRIGRIEEIPAAPHEVISARALAPLPKLVPLAMRFRVPNTICLFPKGRSALSELTEAREAWHMDVMEHRSISDPEGVILAIGHIEARA